MTIVLSEQAAADLDEEMFAKAQHPDPADEQDWLLHQPSWLAEGYVRKIDLREGLELYVDNYRLRDRGVSAQPEREEWLSFHFHLSGQHQDACTEVNNLEYALYGSGLAPKDHMIGPNRYPIVEVTVCMSPQVSISFIGRNGELPPEFRHLVRPADQLYYTRVGTVSVAMQRVLWQIVRCPYLSVTKRMYLEGMALEGVALVLEEEREIQQGRQSSHLLQPDYVDRLYRAREILRQNLHQPPTLMELARRVELNDYLLKQGFRQVFHKTVFGCLHDYRMEQASQLLMSGEMKVIEVMRRVGFSDRKHFAAAFRKKFGVNPSEYLNVQP